MAQLQFLQSQLSPNQLDQEEQADGCEDVQMDIRGGGGNFSNAADSGGSVVVSGWAGVGKSIDSFGGISSSSLNNLGAGQGNRASPNAFNFLVDTLVDDQRANPLRGVVHVPSNILNQVYVCPGWMSHDNRVPQEELFDPKTHKKVMRVISNPSNESFQWVNEITPIGYQINKIPSAKKIYWQKGITDIDGKQLYFSSEAALSTYVNSCRTEEELGLFPGHPQLDLPLEKERSYYPGYAPQDHLSAMQAHCAKSRFSPANLFNWEMPSSENDCGLEGCGGVRE
jgi:hypothetical protein